MLRLAADEDFDNDIVRGLLRREPNLDIMRVHEAGLSGKADPIILEWASREARILLTHDANTMTKYAFDRIEAGETITGVFVIRHDAPLGEIISDILLLTIASELSEWENQVKYIPL